VSQALETRHQSLAGRISDALDALARVVGCSMRAGRSVMKTRRIQPWLPWVIAAVAALWFNVSVSGRVLDDRS